MTSLHFVSLVDPFLWFLCKKQERCRVFLVLLSIQSVSKLPAGYKAKQENFLVLLFLAEREGFEPPVPFSTSVFKTGAIDHSATSPNFCVCQRMWSFSFDVAKVWQKNVACKKKEDFFQKIFLFALFFMIVVPFIIWLHLNVLKNVCKGFGPVCLFSVCFGSCDFLFYCFGCRPGAACSYCSSRWCVACSGKQLACH